MYLITFMHMNKIFTVKNGFKYPVFASVLVLYDQDSAVSADRSHLCLCSFFPLICILIYYSGMLH